MKFHTLLLALLVTVAFLGSFVLCQEAATEAETETIPEAATGEDSAHATDPDASTGTDKGETASESEQPAAAQAESELTESQGQESSETAEPVQSGPFIDLFGPQLYSMEILDETTGQLNAHYTNEILANKKVIGIYFSADWCGPCRQFTPELVSFYERMNNRRGKKDQFQIIWVSRCRDVDAYAQYFAQMPWLALPPEEAMGARGQMLGDKYKTKGIPHFVLIDDLGQTITMDARNKIPQDKAGIGFPWRSPLAQVYVTLVPRSLRLMVKSQITEAKAKVTHKLKSLVGREKREPMAA